MSVPPDDPNGNGSIDDDFVAWRGNDDPPQWFYDAADLFGQLDDRDSVFLEVEGGMGAVERNEEEGTYSLIIHGYDEDTGEDLYWEFNDWDYDSLMNSYGYIEDYYPDVAFWSENYSLANL